jgi:hypothetical protein
MKAGEMVVMLLIRNGETPAVGIWLQYLKHDNLNKWQWQHRKLCL